MTSSISKRRTYINTSNPLLLHPDDVISPTAVCELRQYLLAVVNRFCAQTPADFDIYESSDWSPLTYEGTRNLTILFLIFSIVENLVDFLCVLISSSLVSVEVTPTDDNEATQTTNGTVQTFN